LVPEKGVSIGTTFGNTIFAQAPRGALRVFAVTAYEVSLAHLLEELEKELRMREGLVLLLKIGAQQLTRGAREAPSIFVKVEQRVGLRGSALKARTHDDTATLSDAA
jgi:hypothetical protein